MTFVESFWASLPPMTVYFIGAVVGSLAGLLFGFILGATHERKKKMEEKK